VTVLAKRKKEIERQTNAAPIGWPFWRRVQYRAGSGRCWVEHLCRLWLRH
jgi:hypothetical protein